MQLFYRHIPLCALALCLTACSLDMKWRAGFEQRGGSPTPTATPPAGPYALNGPVSKWVGINADADFPYCDLAHSLAAFTVSGPADANGFPAAGGSGNSKTDVGWELPNGTYKISYVGTGSVSVSGIGKLTGAWTTVGNEHRNTFTVTSTLGIWGQMLQIDIANAAGQSVTAVHIYFQGCDYDDPHLFNPYYFRLLGPFRELRYMSYWLGTNNSTVVNWEDRVVPTAWGSSSNGQPWEYVVQLINETGKDAWINIPQQASDEYVQNLGDFLATNLDINAINRLRSAQGITTPFELIVEYSNETWNTGFTAAGYLRGIASANPTRYSGTYTGTYGPSWMNSTDVVHDAQVEADKLVHFSQILKNQLQPVGLAGNVHPVLSGWALGALYTDAGVRFIQDNYGRPSDYITYVAITSYFGPASVNQTNTLPNLFASTTTGIQGASAVYSDMAALVAQYGLKMSSYEGGDGDQSTVNVSVRAIAQHDVRMYNAYLQEFALWKQNFGEALFNQFVLESPSGGPMSSWQWGMWGSLSSLTLDPSKCGQNMRLFIGTEDPYAPAITQYCPKYQALSEQVR